MKQTLSILRSIRLRVLYVPLFILGGSFILFLWYATGYLRACHVLDSFAQERAVARVQLFSQDDQSEESDDLDNQEGDDEQDVSLDEESFTLVNREPDYLKQRAVSFARKYNLSESVQKLYSGSVYDACSEDAAAEKKVRSKKTRQKVSRNNRSRKMSNQSYARNFTSIDPRFNLPIDRDSFWLSSPFGPRRRSGGKREFHSGIDMAAVHGTPVKAAGEGTVVEVGHQQGYGNVVVIRHEDGFKTRYAHLSKILISHGSQVRAGQVIGKVGATGNARASGKTRDASHLHFEVEKQGKRVNPYYFFK